MRLSLRPWIYMDVYSVNAGSKVNGLHGGLIKNVDDQGVKKAIDYRLRHHGISRESGDSRYYKGHAFNCLS